MRKIIYLSAVVVSVVLFMNCSSNDGALEEDCMKTITLQQAYTIGNQTHYYDFDQEVPCDTPEPDSIVEIEPPALENFSYEVLEFSYSEDEATNMARFKFRIKLNNPNDYAAKGIAVLSLNIDGLQIRANYSNKATVPCTEIAAKSSCTLSFDQESSLDLGRIDKIELQKVEYFLAN